MRAPPPRPDDLSMKTSHIAAALTVVVTVLMTVAAPAASAMPESQIKSECAQASGAYHTFVNADGTRTSECCYKDIKGNKYCDYYENGSYISTGPGRNELPPGSSTPSGPKPPGTVTAPPPAGVNPGTG